MTSCCPTSNNQNMQKGDVRWSVDQIEALYALPFMDLILKAQNTLRDHFQPNAVQYSTLLNFKTGGCPENCSYCPQSAHYKTEVEKEAPMDAAEILQKAQEAKGAGATRFCMGAAWRSVHDRDMPLLEEVVQGVKSLGLETCMTLGMIREDQAEKLKAAGLDYYNHNLDSSKEFYQEIITTRTYQDRLDTLANIDKVGLKTCCGGILGMGESRHDRVGLLHTLSQLPSVPHSIPINQLIPIPGTPLETKEALDPFEFVRTIAVARVMFPASYVRIAAGREQMSDEMQALCFLAGANSVFRGEKLLTNKNPSLDEDDRLFSQLGLYREESTASVCAG